MFVSRPDLQSFFTRTTSHQPTVLEMVNQRTQLSMHIVQWLTAAYGSDIKRLSIGKGLEGVIMGRLIGCGASSMHVGKLFKQNEQHA